MSNQQKNIALVVGFFLLLLISYVFSIQKTLDLKYRLSILEKEKELLANANERIFNLQQENKHLDAILSKRNLSIENSFQQTILNSLNRFSKQTPFDIISFEKPYIFSQNNTSLNTYSFSIQGDFSTLLKLLNSLEKQQLGEIKSLNFEKKRNYRKNKQKLIVQFYLQELSQVSQKIFVD